MHTQFPGTVAFALEQDAARFHALSRAYRQTLRKRAFAFLEEHPSCGDHNGFWRGLSARHVLAISVS
jgi:hypothetical protein